VLVQAQDRASPQKQRLFHALEAEARTISRGPPVAHNVREVDEGKSIDPKKRRIG
jgi:hypothetical protein